MEKVGTPEMYDFCHQSYPNTKLVRNHRGVFRHKPEGLIKKSMTVHMRGHKMHFISYQRQSDVDTNVLPKVHSQKSSIGNFSDSNTPTSSAANEIRRQEFGNAGETYHTPPLTPESEQANIR